jgi:serine/threonine-protein kinase
MSGLVGQNIKKYRVSTRIGRGGMGIVYRALDLTLHRDVAIKVLNPDLHDKEVARRFRAEAVTVARLNHPGIARIYEFFEHEGQWMMVMEYLRGETLERLVERLGPLPAARAADLTLQVLSALAHAHAQDVVHRDLKPANLMLTEAGAVKTMDFGIARVAGAEKLTSAGLMMGTPAYMAPEQVTGGTIDGRTDLFSLGLVLFYLLTARLPFAGETPMDMARSRVDDEPTPIHMVRTGLPDWVQAVLDRALARDPADRFQTADEFHQALLHGMDGREADSEQRTALAIGPILSPSPTGSGRSTGGARRDSASLPHPSGSVGPPSGSVGPPSGSGGPPSAPVPHPSASVPASVASTAVSSRSSKAALVIAAVIVIVTIGGAWAWVTWQRSSLPPPAPGGSVAADATKTPAPATETATSPASAPGTATPPAASSPSPSPSASPTPGATTAGASRSGRALATPDANAPLVAFSDVKLLRLRGQKLEEEDAVLNFVAGQVSLTPRKGGPALAAMPLRQIVKATYIHARDPVWSAGLPMPPTGLDYPGRSSRHWLALQSAAAYLLVRLDDMTWRSVLFTLESRAPLKVDRRN